MRVRIPVCLIAAAIPCASIVTPACAGVLQTFGTAGSGSGQFKQPQGIALDSSGNVLVADGLDNRIDRFSPTWRVWSGDWEL
jgi:hypothetical protein